MGQMAHCVSDDKDLLAVKYREANDRASGPLFCVFYLLGEKEKRVRIEEDDKSVNLALWGPKSIIPLVELGNGASYAPYCQVEQPFAINCLKFDRQNQI